MTMVKDGLKENEKKKKKKQRQNSYFQLEITQVCRGRTRTVANPNDDE